MSSFLEGLLRGLNPEAVTSVIIIILETLLLS
jgi:hypothetical protein